MVSPPPVFCLLMAFNSRLGGEHAAVSLATAFWPKIFAASFAPCFDFRALTGTMTKVRKRVCATNTLSALASAASYVEYYYL